VAWYNNDAHEALDHFNYARKDGEWGRQAIMNMIEIYLNPDNAGLFQEASEAKGDHSEHVAVAEKLLKELQSQCVEIGNSTDTSLQKKVKVLESYCYMATKHKPRVEKGLQILMSIMQEDKEYVPGLLGMANAFVLLNQTPKARNQLKLISKMKTNHDYNGEFEKAWLMLSDIYIGSGKYDLAQELCKKCLKNNKSCAKSWEFLGLVMEKEQSYRDAADNYEHAWHYMNESSATVGYKLAFNYLKAKRYVEAIDVCHKVLSKHPNYPKIRKDILDKARAALRP